MNELDRVKQVSLFTINILLGIVFFIFLTWLMLEYVIILEGVE